jgi:hypothetical protein
MLFAIHRGQVEGYQDGQRPVLHLVSAAERLAEANTAFTFTDGHAKIAYSAFYEDLADLASKIDWNVMRSQYWNDDPPRIVDRKRKRQAEFLVPRFFPWQLFSTIGVINDVVRTEVMRVLDGADHQPEVRVQRNWYY